MIINGLGKESIQSVDNILNVMQQVNGARVNEKGRLYYVIDPRSGILGVTRDAALASSDQDVTHFIREVFKAKNDFNKVNVSSEFSRRELLSEAVIKMMAFGEVSQVAIGALKNALQAAVVMQAGMPESIRPPMNQAIGEFARVAVSAMIKINQLNQ